MNLASSLDHQIEPAQSAEAAEDSALLVDPNHLWEQYESCPDCYDGVALAIQRSWLGIIWAGAIVAAIIFLGFVIYDQYVVYSVTRVLISIPLLGVVGVFGGLMAAFWSVFAIIAVMVLNFCLLEVLDRRTAVAMSGGGTGFLMTYWPMFDYANAELYAIAICVAVTFLTTAMCQVGAIWWGRREYALYVPRRKAEDGPPPVFQFKITHIMIATACFGLLFMVNGFFERHEVLLMASTYVLIQTILLVFDWLLFRRRKKTGVDSA